MCRGINDGKDIDPDFMASIYEAIEKDPISLAEDDEARLKEKSNLATDLKARQKVFDDEADMLRKKGTMALKESTSTDMFILVEDIDGIGALFSSIWGAMFAVFSYLFEVNTDEVIISHCIEGFLNSIKICGYYNMEMERNAFSACLARFANLNSKKEMQEKNIICVRTLLQLGLENGNCLGDSWKHVLECVSQVNFYLNRGAGVKQDAEVFFNEEETTTPRSNNQEARNRIIQVNAEMICNSIDESDLDKIVSRSTYLDENSIVEFTDSLCKVSDEELNSRSNPSIFSLQKLVEVADTNMNHRT